jgi:hypothetical protein
LFAQGELTLPFMEHVFQASYVNPIAMPEHRLSIGLPGISSIYLNLANTGFSANDGIAPSATSGVKPKFDIRKAINAMGSSNLLTSHASVDLFHIRFKHRFSYFSFNIGAITNNYFSYPQDLANFASLNTLDENGSARDFDLSKLAMSSTTYLEYAFGYMKKKGDFSYGFKLKILDGFTNLDFSTENLIVKVDPIMYNYSLNATAKARVNAPRLDKDLNTTSTGNDLTPFKNLGYGLDLGFGYNFNKKLSLSVAITNIGVINWTSNPIEYSVSPNVSFKGVDVLSGLVSGSTQSLTGTNVLDTLENQFKPKGANINSYQTWLIPRFYINLRYNVTPKLTIGASLYLEHYKTLRPAYIVGTQYKFTRFLSLAMTATYQNKFNFGTGLVIKPGPFQFYFVTDNLNTIFDPLNSKAFNLRFGMNLVFGRINLPQKQALDKK